MMKKRSARLGQITREAGTSLVELLVVLSLLAVVLPVAYSAVNVMQNEATITSNRFQALSEAQVIVDRIAKDLRTGVSPNVGWAPFTFAGETHVTFYASLFDPNGPVKIDAYVTPLFAGSTINAFHEDATTADAAPPGPPYAYSGSVRIRLDGQYVDTTAPGQVIFTYFDTNNLPLAINRTIAPVLSPPGLLPADLANIDSVGISLTTRITPTAPSTTISTRIHVRNVDYNPDGD